MQGSSCSVGLDEHARSYPYAYTPGRTHHSEKSVMLFSNVQVNGWLVATLNVKITLNVKKFTLRGDT